MNEFGRYHPIVNFAYFAFAIIFSCIYMHPAALAISLCTALGCSAAERGVRQLKKSLAYIAPTALLAAVINPAFSHAGVTIITYLPSGNPLTLESICYGLAAASMIASVMLFFGCLTEIITSDKLIYFFGRILPSLSLLLSMTLRFVPRFAEQFAQVSRTQKCLGRDMSHGGISSRARSALSVLSVMVTLSLENSADTADSMRDRGYGLPGRTAFSIYKFSKRDAAALAFTLGAAAYVIIGTAHNAMQYTYFPSFNTAEISPYSISVFAAYFALLSLPVIIEISEVIKWKYTTSKI